MEGTCTALNILQASHISLLPNNLFSMQPHFARTRYHRTRSLSAVISPNEEGDRLPGEREDGRKRGLRGHFRGSFHLHGYAERYARRLI